MRPPQGWLKRQRTALWHLRHGGLPGYKEWQKRQRAPRPSKKFGSKPQSVTVSDLDVPVIAGLATMPSRLDLLRESFNSIYWQVDEVHVFLNNFESVPDFLHRPRTKIYRSQDYEDYKDVGKFFALNYLSEGILFTIDDDILYPPDYVSKMLSYLAATNFSAAIGVHGFQLPRFPKSFFDRRLFHFRTALEDVSLVSVLGTGTTVFNIAKLKLSFDDFPTYGMADIHFARFLKKQEVPALIIPRPAEWLKPLSASNDDVEVNSLFDQTVQNAAQHSTFLRSAAPWGEEDTLLRWKSLSGQHILSQPLVEALQLIAGVRENVQEGKEGDKGSFQASLPWIELYTDIPTREQLLTQAFDVNSPSKTRHAILRALWKINTTKALELSRDAIRTKPFDIAALRLHANLCAGYLLYDEAEKYYLQALQRAGTKDLKTTRSILFEYFRFLIRCRDYEKAVIIGSSLKVSHSRTHLFMAFMSVANLHTGRVEEAKVWLTSLFKSQRRSTREKAIGTLVKAIAEDPPALSEEVSLLGLETITHNEAFLGDLIALLKIATVAGDKCGAEKVWKVLEERHREELASRPELEQYFTTNWSTERSGTTSLVGHKKVLNMESGREVTESGPLVSVLLTAYNSEETLGCAIESILNQSHRNIELIVVDDMSSDATVDIAESWTSRDPRVILLKNEENLGPYVSRNVALKYAQGEFVALQDADDVSVPDRLRIQLEEFTPNTKAVLGQHMRVDREGRIHLENDGSILGHGPVTLMMRRQVIQDLGVFSGVRTRGDKEFESRIEHYYGSDALKRTSNVLVYALHDSHSNSKLETATADKRRRLMLFKEKYTRKHSLHMF